MKSITYAIRDGSNRIVRHEVLPEGKGPSLAPEVHDPVAGILAGETADIIAITELEVSEPDTVQLELSLSKAAEVERSRILNQPGIAAALLSRAITPNSKLSDEDLNVVTEAQAALAAVDLEQQVVLEQIKSPDGDAGILLPDWAK